MSQRAGFISQFWFNIGPWNFSKGFRSEYSRQIKRLFHDFQKHTTIKKKVVSDLFEVNKIKLWLRFHLFVPAAKPINLQMAFPSILDHNTFASDFEGISSEYFGWQEKPESIPV